MREKKKPILWIGLLTLFMLFCCSLPYSISANSAFQQKQNQEIVNKMMNKQETVILGIPVLGDPDFLMKLELGLQNLKQKSFYDFQYVSQYVGRIEQGDHSVVTSSKKIPIVYMNPRTLERVSIPSVGSWLVHEACHVEMYRSKDRDPSKNRYDNQQRGELKCIQKEAYALKKLGGTQDEDNFLYHQDGLHFDVNKDGKWTSEDTKAQNW